MRTLLRDVTALLVVLALVVGGCLVRADRGERTGRAVPDLVTLEVYADPVEAFGSDPARYADEVTGFLASLT